jgi:hypothetical protein
MVSCKKCTEPMPPKRLELGYTVCVECSTEKRFGAVPVTNHKTGNTIEVIKDPEQAAKINAMMQRKGFGIMAGIAGSHKKTFTEAVNSQVKITEGIPPRDRVISRRMPSYDYENVGHETIAILEKTGIDPAMEHIQKCLSENRIYGKQARQLEEIVKIFSLENS